jgi:hypothetical protein
MLETAKVYQINVICLDFNSLVEIIVKINYGNTYGNNYMEIIREIIMEINATMIAGNSLYWGLADSIIDQKVRKKV